MTQIKICGLTKIQDMEAVNRWKPDYIGFVFAKSKRQVTSEKAKFLKERLHPDIKSVGVFVNEQIETITQIVNDCSVDIVQLHGDESRFNTEEVHIEPRTGKGQPMVMVLMDNVVVKLVRE